MEEISDKELIEEVRKRNLEFYALADGLSLTQYLWLKEQLQKVKNGEIV